jgi:hypothetical protein
MKSPSLRLPRRPFAASEEPALEDASVPEPAQLESADETTAPVPGAIVEAEDVEDRTAASDSPKATTDEAPEWCSRFESVEQMWREFRLVDSLRGRLANEVGQLRQRVELYERIDDLLAQADLDELQLLLEARLLSRRPEARERLESMIEIGERVSLAEEVANGQR